MIERHELGDGTAHRDANEVRPGKADGAEQAYGIVDEIPARVVGGPGLIGDRSAGVAVVVADDEAGAGGEALTELILPPVHRGARSPDQENRGVAAIAERLDAELDAVGLDDPLAHGSSLSC